MDQLAAVARALGLDAEAGASGRWLRIRGRRTFYLLKALWSDDYYLWCEPPAAPATEIFRDALEAFEMGLGRAGAAAGSREGHVAVAAGGGHRCRG